MVLGYGRVAEHKQLRRSASSNTHWQSCRYWDDRYRLGELASAVPRFFPVLRRPPQSSGACRRLRPQVFALLFGGGDGSSRRRAARIVPILHAFLEESIARLALQSLLVRTELAGRDFLLGVDCKTRPGRQ
jgi:hypothetical protein